MKFTKLTEDEYRKYWESSPMKCFMSAPEISQLHENAKIFYLGVKKGDKVVAAAMIRGTKRRWGYDYYSPRGILLDYTDSKLLEFFIFNIKKFLRREKGYIFRMDPNLELIERDIDGNIVPGGRNNGAIVSSLKKLGFKKSKLIKDVSQVTWQFVLPVENKDEAAILNNMGPHTRHRLNQALDFGIKTKDLRHGELKASFYDILANTAKRKNFSVRNFEYFEKMFKSFGPIDGIEYVSAVINPKKSLASLSKKLKSIESQKPQNPKEKKIRSDTIKSINGKMKKIRQSFPDAQDEDIVLASGMFMTLHPEILHLFGGNDEKYMKFDGQYVLQWEMIRRAIKGGYARYNFYGIPENINTHPSDYGVYAYKRGFSGHVEELIGEYELPLSWGYYLSKALSIIKRR